MHRFSGNHAIAEPFRNAIVALGNFDGFHRGHQAVVGRAVEMAKAAGVPAIVATFDPHPVRHFRPDAPPFRLTSLDQRQRLFGEAGADAMVVFDFGAELASVSATDFVSDWLCGNLGASGIVTGEDFTFGQGRSGNAQILNRLCEERSLKYEAVGQVRDGEVVSSSRIRAALQAGDCAMAARLLTRPFAIEGVVQHGDKNGRKLGYPTANVELGSYLRPLYGVYAVKARLPDGSRLNGAANIGIRPQFDPPKELLEPHFFDFEGDLYGQKIEVEFHAFIRGEAKFADLDALTKQIGEDCTVARTLLA